MRRAMPEQARFTVDTPVPYRISDLTGLIDERMGKLENKRDLSPYRKLRTRIEIPSRRTAATPSCSARSPSTTA